MFPNPQDALPLPHRPNLERYKNLAKDLLKACKSADSSAIRAWAERWVESLATLADVKITPELPARLDRWTDGVEAFVRRKLLEANTKDASQEVPPEGTHCTLAGAQFVIARSHGFESWPRFAKHIEALGRTNSPVSNFEAAADAVVAGDLPTLERLLREDPALARANSTREHGATLLHYVSANGVEGYRQRTARNAARVAEFLLNAGAEVDATANVYGGGATTLALVATSIHPERAGVQDELLALLLSRGAKMKTDSGSVDSAESGRVNDENATSAPGIRATNRLPLVNACLANGRSHAAEFLAHRGAALDLEAACGVGALEALANFFHEDGSLKATATTIQMERGFLWACEYGRTSVIDFLLEKRIDLESQANTGQKAMHWAVIGGQCDTIKLLIARGASIESRNVYGGTPLGQALWSAVNADTGIDYVRVIEILLAAGAKVEEDSLAWLAKQDARSSSVKQRIAELLRQHGTKP